MRSQANTSKSDTQRGWRRGRARRVLALASLGGLTALLTVFVASLYASELAGPPRFIGEPHVQEIRPTRAEAGFNVEPRAAAFEWKVEYATEAVGPWTVAGSGVRKDNPGEERVALEIDHLAPATGYYLRVELKSEHGEAQDELKFTTLAIGPPEFLDSAEVCPESRSLAPETANVCGQAGASVADFGIDLYAAGAETSWSAEYSDEKIKVQEGKGTPIPGASGTISVAEEDAEFLGDLSGLSPETTYYLRVKVTNAKGTTAPIVSFVTTAHPENLSVGKPSDIVASSAHLGGLLVAHEQETHWHFEYATVKEAEANHWTEGPGGTIPAAVGDNSHHAVEADLSGLAPDTVYYVRLFAENSYGHSTSSTYAGFETAGPTTVSTFPTHTIHGESLRLLGSTSLSPKSGDMTAYRFEYVTKGQFEEAEFSGASVTPGSSLEGGRSETLYIESSGHKVELVVPASEVVGQDLPGLRSGETYEYRLVATDEEGTVDGAVKTLTVPALPASGAEESCPNESLRTGASAGLPACRAYEQVTPVNKEGASDIFTWAGATQDNALVGEDGEHLFFYASVNAIGSNAAAFGGGYFFSRTGEGKWQMTSATPQPETGFNEYKLGEGGGLFNADLTEVGFTSSWITGATSSPEQAYKLGSSGGPYQTVASIPRGNQQSNRWAGASADFKTLVLKTADHKLLGVSTPTSSSSGSGPDAGLDLYEYSEGRLRQLNVDSQGETIGTCGASLAAGDQGEVEEGSGVHAISADGSRAFFNASPGGTCESGEEGLLGGPNWQLYMRVDGSSTVDIGEYGFLGANAEGTKLLLRKKVGAGSEFFLYDTETLTAKPLFSTPGRVEGPISAGPFVSEDLGTIYFTSREQLTPEAPASTPASDIPGVPNDKLTYLYRYDVATETLHFALVISQSSGSTTAFKGPFMSPDGRFLYWTSNGNPAVPRPGKYAAEETGELRDGSSSQLYRYDDVENLVQCVSCASSSDPEPLFDAVTEAAFNQFKDNSADGVPRLRIASDDGDHVFFQTIAALVPQDINGEVPPEPSGSCQVGCEYPGGSPSYDVYEWRPPGVSGCAYIQGCIALISGGREGLRNTLLGTTPSGRDVFLATHEALVTQDTDTAGDIYDARIGGGEPPPALRPVECEGDACAAPFAPPGEITPASSTFQGAGDVTVAPAGAKIVKQGAKKPKKKRAVKKKRRRRGKGSRARRSAHTSRGGAR